MAVRAGTAAGITAAAEENFNEKGPRERAFFYLVPSFRDGPKDQTRNLEIPGSMLRIAPE
jgi:hypothetical protein